MGREKDARRNTKPNTLVRCYNAAIVVNAKGYNPERIVGGHRNAIAASGASI